MAKYIFDVCFDVPANVLASLPKENTLASIKSNVELDRFDPATSNGEYSTIRIACEGSDSWCNKFAKKATITIGKDTFKARGIEIIHCQG